MVLSFLEVVGFGQQTRGRTEKIYLREQMLGTADRLLATAGRGRGESSKFEQESFG